MTMRALFIAGSALAAFSLPLAALAQESPPRPSTADEAEQPDPEDQAPPADADIAQADTSAGAPSDETIIVTGSRIPRANFDTVQPAVVLGGQQIEERGYTNLGDALDELPAFGVPGGNRVGAQAGAFGAGQTFVNF